MRGRHGALVRRVFYYPHGVVVYRGGCTVDLQLKDKVRTIQDDRWSDVSIEQMATMLDEILVNT
jgi:hypothetical protein